MKRKSTIPSVLKVHDLADYSDPNRRLNSDPHNFGRVVTKRPGMGSFYFYKPRPVYWERFFFGLDSPLRQILGGDSPFDDLFYLETQIENSNSGIAKAVEPSSNPPKLLREAGALIAYCYLWGIMDLHAGNVILTDDGPRVVDVEMVFVNALLPDESLLLPFKEIEFENSGLSRTLGKLPLDSTSMAELLNGFFSMLRFLDGRLESLRELCLIKLREATKIPIRVIMRNTMEYFTVSADERKNHFFEAEVEQLERNDIPYFFKFLYDPNVYYYTSAEFKFKKAEIPADLVSAVDRAAVDPLTLLTSSRLRSELFPRGVLLLARKLLDPNHQGAISCEFGELKAGENEFDIVSDWGKFQTTRYRRTLQ